MTPGDIVRHRQMKQRGWHRWTKAEHTLLVRKYKTCGDKSIAEMLNEKFPKEYPWTDKHVEKRRKYFGLSRGRKSGDRIDKRNNIKKIWDTRGRAQEGEIKHWMCGGRLKPHIKINGRFVDYARWKVSAEPGQVVRSFEGGLRKIDRVENQRLNAKLRVALPPELKQTVTTLNKLKKLIHGKENRRPARNTV